MASKQILHDTSTHALAVDAGSLKQQLINSSAVHDMAHKVVQTMHRLLARSLC